MQRIQYVPYRQLVDCTMALAGKIPHDVCGVAGIPRSGMLPATILATMLHLPLFAATTTGLIDLGHGKRRLHASERGRYLIVDDSAYRGMAMAKALSAAGLARERLITAAVFAHPHHLRHAPERIDIYERVIPSVRFFEWNIFNHSMSKRMMSDIDGVLCKDSPVRDNDGELYADALLNALPHHLPRRRPLHTLITHRLERWRSVTTQWLNRYDVRYGTLTMALQISAQQRRVNMKPYGKWKGEVFRDSPCLLFIESSASQARIIHRVSRKPVISLKQGIIFR